MFITILIIAAALIVGGLCGYLVFRYVLTGKYKEMIDTATKEADVIKEKKLLEVKEKFLNKKSELEKEVQQRNQKIQNRSRLLKNFWRNSDENTCDQRTESEYAGDPRARDIRGGEL